MKKKFAKLKENTVDIQESAEVRSLAVRLLIGQLQQTECRHGQQDDADGHQEAELISVPHPLLCLHLCDFPVLLLPSFLSFLKRLQFSLKHTNKYIVILQARTHARTHTHTPQRKILLSTNPLIRPADVRRWELKMTFMHFSTHLLLSHFSLQRCSFLCCTSLNNTHKTNSPVTVSPSFPLSRWLCVSVKWNLGPLTLSWDGKVYVSVLF